MAKPKHRLRHRCGDGGQGSTDTGADAGAVAGMAAGSGIAVFVVHVLVGTWRVDSVKVPLLSGFGTAKNALPPLVLPQARSVHVRQARPGGLPPPRAPLLARPSQATWQKRLARQHRLRCEVWAIPCVGAMYQMWIAPALVVRRRGTRARTPNKKYLPANHPANISWYFAPQERMRPVAHALRWCGIRPLWPLITDGLSPAPCASALKVWMRAGVDHAASRGVGHVLPHHHRPRHHRNQDQILSLWWQDHTLAHTPARMHTRT